MGQAPVTHHEVVIERPKLVSKLAQQESQSHFNNAQRVTAPPKTAVPKMPNLASNLANKFNSPTNWQSNAAVHTQPTPAQTPMSTAPPNTTPTWRPVKFTIPQKAT